MQKLIRTVLLLLAVLCGAGAYAQSASQILTDAAKKIGSAPSLSASFTATAPGGETEKGTLLLAREKFAMVTPVYGVWYDGESMWSYYKQNGECSLTEPTEEELMEVNPFDIVSQWDKHYKAALAAKTKTDYTVKLTPVKASSEVKSATIVIDAATKLPKAIDARFSNGSAIAISLSGVTVGATAPQISRFRFPASQYPGVEVVDLR